MEEGHWTWGPSMLQQASGAGTLPSAHGVVWWVKDCPVSRSLGLGSGEAQVGGQA